MNLKDWRPDQVKFLVIGDTGTGKTQFAGTFPKPYVFSFDGGIDTLAGRDIEYDIFIEDNRHKPTQYGRFLQEWDRISADPRYQTLVLDNLTLLSKYIFDELLFTNNLTDKKLGDNVWDLYRMLKFKMHDIIVKAQTKAKFVVCTAFPEWETDKNTGEMRVFPSTEGRIRQELAGWFGEVYYTWVERDAKTKELKFSLKTKADGKYIAKSRLDGAIKALGGTGLPDPLKPDYNELLKHMSILTKVRETTNAASPV